MKRIVKALAAGLALTLLLAQPAKAEQESWYTYWGLGWSSTSPEANINGDKVSVTTDLLGFYFPVAPSTIVGFVINASADRYTRGSNWVQQNYYLLGPSAMHFLGDEPGAGLFLRADAGLAWSGVIDDDGNSAASDKSWGVLVGGGYGIPISGETRILLNVNYAIRNIEGEKAKTLGVSIGGLW